MTWLHWWNDVFTNEGHGTLHNAAFTGCGVFEPSANEVMQIEAGMGAVAAIHELLVECRGALVVVLPNLPTRWRDLHFDNIWVEGGFRIGATVQNSQIVEVRVQATRAGQLTLAHGIKGHWRSEIVESADAILNAIMSEDQQIVLRNIQPQ